MQKSQSYIYYGVSLAGVSCRRRWPAPTSRPDNAVGLVGRQLGGNFLITGSVYVDQTLCTVSIMEY